MAKLKANVRPIPSRPGYREFVGTCSNCRTKRTTVIKIKNAQVCNTCLGGVQYPEDK